MYLKGVILKLFELCGSTLPNQMLGGELSSRSESLSPSRAVRPHHPCQPQPRNTVCRPAEGAPEYLISLVSQRNINMPC